MRMMLLMRVHQVVIFKLVVAVFSLKYDSPSRWKDRMVNVQVIGLE